MRYTAARKAQERGTPIECTFLTSIPCEMHAPIKMHAHEMHAHEMHAYEMPIL
jgi:hypothetical protein